MSTVSFPELDAAEAKLATKNKELADIFAEGMKDGQLDTTLIKSIPGNSADKVKFIQNLNAELTEIGEERDGFLAIKAAHTALDRQNTESWDRHAERGDNSRRGAKSVGERFTSTERSSLKQFRHEFDDVNVKEFLKATMTTAAGWAPDVVRESTMIPYATRPIEILDYIPMTPTRQTAVTYMEETTFTNAAAERAEGGAKAESTLVLTERTSQVRSIATSMGVTDEQIEDVDGIEDYLDARLPFFLRQRLEGQVLAGDGSAPNLRGFLNTSGIQTQAKGADPVPDAIYKAMVLVMTTGQAMPDAVIMNPLDWQDVRLLRTADGIYIWGNPSEAAPERIWGLPVLLSQAETQNTAIVGAFKMFTALRVKKGITIERGFINDDFTKDITRLRAEMRAALVVYRPAALCTVTGV